MSFIGACIMIIMHRIYSKWKLELKLDFTKTTTYIPTVTSDLFNINLIANK